jgi:hypothetical protein
MKDATKPDQDRLTLLMRLFFTFPTNPRIRGSLDGASRGRLHGWVLDRAAPLRRLTVEVQVPNGKQVTLLADRYRADVHQNGLGDGYCGFSVPLQHLGASGPVRVACTDPRVELGAIDVSRSRPATPAPMVFEQGACVLTVDMPIGLKHISGWAANRTCPTSRRMLRLRVNGRTLAQQRATLFRSDAAAFLADGYHGFWLSLPTTTVRKLYLDDIDTGLAFLIRH